MRLMMKRIIICCLFLILSAGLPINTYAAATPIISESKANPPDCYYHYDGQIWIYSTSGYQSEVKAAIKLLNKKYNVFRYTKAKNKRDVWIYDKSKPANKYTCALTNQYKSTIILYRSNFKKMNRTKRILSIAHEIGHAAGLDHSISRFSIMYSYIDKMKAKGLSAADVKALKQARSRATNRNKGRKSLLNNMLVLEKYNLPANLTYTNSIGKGWIFAFPKRGTVYQSSDSKVISISANGIMTVKGTGTASLKINNAGTIHVFKFNVH